jgi:hypothetical protein
MGTIKKKEITPIMAAFGLAVFEGQNFEHGLGHLLWIIDEELKKEGRKPLNDDIDKIRITSGQLFRRVKKVEVLSDKEIEVIQRGIDDRNYLVHHYWKNENMLATATPDGRKKILEDLDDRRENCRQARRLVGKLIDAYLVKYGTSISALSSPFVEQWINDEQTFNDKLH